MTTWLRRQEAVKDRIEFHRWLSVGAVKAVSDSTFEDDEDNEDEEDIYRFSPSITPRAYRIAENCPYRCVMLRHLQVAHSATEFLPALHTFIRNYYPRSPFVPQPTHTYNAYNN